MEARTGRLLLEDHVPAQCPWFEGECDSEEGKRMPQGYQNMLYFIQDFSHLNCLAAYPGNGNLSVVCQFIPEEQRSVNAETLSLAAQEKWNALTGN